MCQCMFCLPPDSFQRGEYKGFCFALPTLHYLQHDMQHDHFLKKLSSGPLVPYKDTWVVDSSHFVLQTMFL